MYDFVLPGAACYQPRRESEARLNVLGPERQQIMRSHTISMLLLSLALTSACGDSPKKKTAATSNVTAEAPGPTAETEAPSVEETSSETPPANLEDVLYFGFDSSDLDEAAKSRLQNNADWMKEDATRVLTIEGHTDEEGTTDYNLALGERRARITRDYLVRLGVDGGRIQIITYGEEKPAGSDDSLNRRSVFVATRK